VEVPKENDTYEKIVEWIESNIIDPNSFAAKPVPVSETEPIRFTLQSSRTEMGTARYSVPQEARYEYQLTPQEIVDMAVDSSSWDELTSAMIRDAEENSEPDYEGDEFDYDNHETSDTDNYETSFRDSLSVTVAVKRLLQRVAPEQYARLSR
jgi:hypothetical protein